MSKTQHPCEAHFCRKLAGDRMRGKGEFSIWDGKGEFSIWDGKGEGEGIFFKVTMTKLCRLFRLTVLAKNCF